MPAAVVLALLAGCGGGGGGGTGGPASQPTPLPSPVRPLDPPGPASSTAEIILRNGDVLSDGLVVGNIEDAALAAGRVAALVTVSGSGGARAITVRERAEDARFDTVFNPGLGQSGIDARSLSRLRIAVTGEIVFQSGVGLDTDRLHVLIDDEVPTIAGAPPGPVYPDFRILGNVRIGLDGVVAFVGGGQECEVTPGLEQPRITCTNALYVAEPDGDVLRLDDTELDLANQRATAIRVEMDPFGGAWFSLPRRRTAPVLLHHAAGETTAVLTGESELAGIGALNAVEVVAINEPGDVLLEVTHREVEGERRPTSIGRLRGEDFAPFAREGTTLGGENVALLRGLGIDDSGRALFEARYGAFDRPNEHVRSLWYGDENGLVEIVRERAPFPGEEATVINLQASRLNRFGDIAFLTRLGTVHDDGTVRIEDVRATVRRADGRLVNVASSRNTAQLGEITTLSVVGFDREGSLLLIATRSRSSDRVLLLGRSDEEAG